jgi:dTDP-glucose 4,6-dehydratase
MLEVRPEKRLLITGGAGFIGTNFVHYWHERYPDDRLVVLDALTYAVNRANLAALEDHPTFRFVQGDIGDRLLVDRLLAEEAIAWRRGCGRWGLTRMGFRAALE